MHFLTIAMILSSAAASASASSTTSPEIRLRDPKASFKINKAAFYEPSSFTATIGNETMSLNLKNVLDTCEDRNFSKLAKLQCTSIDKVKLMSCRNNLFKVLRSVMLANKNEALRQLQSEEDALGIVVEQLRNLYPNSTIWAWSKAALDSEKKDWELVLAVVNFMESKVDSELGTRNYLSALNPSRNDIQALNSLLVQLNPSSKALSEFNRTDVRAFKDLVTVVRKWIIANALFGNGPTTVDQLNPNDFINSRYLENFVKMINVPESRFKVLPIEPTLNLSYLMSVSGLSLEEAVNTLKRNMEAYRSKFGSNDVSNNINLRDYVIRGLFYKSADAPLTMESIRKRVKAFGRIAEGVIRSMHEGKDGVDSSITTDAIKAWIMAKQMIDIDGWKSENVKFGLLPLPAGVTLNLADGPAVNTAAAANSRSTSAESSNTTLSSSPSTENATVDKGTEIASGLNKLDARTRSNSTESTASNSSTVSNSSKGSLLSKIFKF